MPLFFFASSVPTSEHASDEAPPVFSVPSGRALCWPVGVRTEPLLTGLCRYRASEILRDRRRRGDLAAAGFGAAGGTSSRQTENWSIRSTSSYDRYPSLERGAGERGTRGEALEGPTGPKGVLGAVAKAVTGGWNRGREAMSGGHAPPGGRALCPPRPAPLKVLEVEVQRWGPWGMQYRTALT